MKIKELHLRNIASIETADIDFEKDIKDIVTNNPASIFLIAGDTGAGKSVILDGISMALYKKTPRIEGVANKTKNEYTNHEGESININSIDQYTRLGISDEAPCYSELVFEGNDGNIYHAKLELGMTKGKKDASGKRSLKHSTPKWQYKKGNEDWKDVEKTTGEPILSAIGLSFEQFGRMAMLAQGQFASFLTGDKSEREQILEQLTNTEIFTKYGDAIHNLFSKAKENKSIVETAFEIEKTHTLAPEKLKEFNNSLENLKKKQENLKKELKEKEDILTIVKEIINNNKEKQEIEKEKTTLEGIVAGNDYKTQKTLVQDWDTTNNERADFSKKGKAEQQKYEAEEAIKSAKKTFELLSSDILFRENENSNAKAKAKEIQTWIDARKHLDDVYTKSDKIVLQLQNYTDTCNKISNNTSSLSKKQGETKILTTNVSTCEKNLIDAKTEAQKKQAAIDTLTKRRNSLNPIEINANIKTQSQRKAELEKLQTYINENEEKRKQTEDINKSIEEDTSKLLQYQSEYNSAQKIYEDKKQEEEDTRSLLTTMQMSTNDTVKELRRRLQKEHANTCPLCGQSITTHCIEEDFQHILSPLEEKENKAKDELNKATKQRDAAKQIFDEFKGKLENKKKNYNKDIEDLKKKDDIIKKEANKLGITISQITNEIEKASTLIKSLEEKQNEVESLQNNINKLTDEKKPLDNLVSNRETELSKAKNAVDLNNKEIEQLKKSITENQQTKDSLTKDLSILLTATYSLWASNTASVINQIQLDAKEYCGKKDEIKDKYAKIESAEKILTTIKRTQNSITAKHNSWETTLLTPIEYKTIDINNEWTQLYSKITTQEETITKAQTEIEQTTSTLNTYYRKTGKTENDLVYIIQSDSKIDTARNFITDTNANLKSRKDAITKCEQNIEERLTKLNAENIENIPDKTLLETRIEDLKNQNNKIIGDISTIETQLKENKENEENLKQAKEKFNEAKATYEKWNRIDKIFGGTRFRTLVQTYILRPLLNNANIYLEKITDRYTLTCSEENEQLSILVLDRYNKNQVRSVTVLSGGERFMISLALSLALSSLNRPDLNVNILFIDEGFGTLDEKNLDSVMATLEKLQEIAGQSNRRVGIISHREELVERIPNQIQVKKKGEGRSIVEIVNE